jgi:hypothetical protein
MKSSIVAFCMVSLPSEKKPSRFDFKFLLAARGAYASKKCSRRYHRGEKLQPLCKYSRTGEQLVIFKILSQTCILLTYKCTEIGFGCGTEILRIYSLADFLQQLVCVVVWEGKSVSTNFLLDCTQVEIGSN